MGFDDRMKSNLAHLSAISDTARRFREQNREIFEKMRPALQQSLEFQRRFAAKIGPLSESFIRSASAGWPKFSKPLRILAENGWFTSWTATPVAWIYPLARLFEDGKTETANRRLRSHFNEQMTSIESRLRKQFPRRASILRKAFSAHRRRDYELSIPVFLIQADGIARDIMGGDIYSRLPRKAKKIRAFVDQITFSEFQRELIELILLPIPLTASTGDPILIKGALARHLIVHGIETKYATATNSFRAISWLQYVASFKHQLEIATGRQRKR